MKTLTDLMNYYSTELKRIRIALIFIIIGIVVNFVLSYVHKNEYIFWIGFLLLIVMQIILFIQLKSLGKWFSTKVRPLINKKHSFYTERIMTQLLDSLQESIEKDNPVYIVEAVVIKVPDISAYSGLKAFLLEYTERLFGEYACEYALGVIREKYRKKN